LSHLLTAGNGTKRTWRDACRLARFRREADINWAALTESGFMNTRPKKRRAYLPRIAS